VQAAKGGPGWERLQSYLLLQRLAIREGRGEGSEGPAARLLRERPDRLLAALLLEEPELEGPQAGLLRLLAGSADLAVLAQCDPHLLAGACGARREVLAVLLGAVARALQGEPVEPGAVEQAARVLAGVLASPHSLDPAPLLEGLDSSLASLSTFTRAELHNWLAAKLSAS
jgi:hypothetical protein